MSRQYNNFAEFYPFYIQEHSHPVSRRLHFVGSWLVLFSLAHIILVSAWTFLWVPLVCGYGFAWVGHFFYQKNRPATFTNPIYSFTGDWFMFRDIIMGKVDLSSHLPAPATDE
jgi:hypothetical protein